MSTLTAAPHRSAATSSARQTFAHQLRAEQVSFWSLRGNVVSLIVGAFLAIAMAVGFAAIWGASTARDAEALPADAAPPLIALALNGIAVLQAVAVLLGVSAYAKEHSTGALRTRLAAAPDRLGMLGAKAVVVGVVSLVWSLVVALLSAAGVAVLYAVFDLPITFTSPVTQIVLPLVGAAVLVALTAVLGLAVAVLLRSETWAVTLVLLFLLLLPTVLVSLPFDWALPTAELLMGYAGQTLTQVHDTFDAAVLRDVAITVAWPAAAMVAAALVLRRRDA